MRKHFHAFSDTKTTLHTGAVGDLQKWIQRYIDALFPENGIEYWTDNSIAKDDSGALKPLQRFAELGAVHHIACYAREGNIEGRFISVNVVIWNGGIYNVTWAKSFGPDDECWAIARACTEALESIFIFEEAPALVEMADRVPRAHPWHRYSSLTDPVGLYYDDHSLRVVADVLVLDDCDWSAERPNAHLAVEARLADWQLVLANMKVPFSLHKGERRIVVDDLPGYVISDRGVPDCDGLYVLPPGGSPNDDRHYLGFFRTDAAAIDAARQHLARCAEDTAPATAERSA